MGSLIVSAAQLLFRSSYWTLAAFLGIGIAALEFPEFVVGKYKTLCEAHPEYAIKWRPRRLHPFVESLMKMPGRWAWTIFGGLLFVGFVNTYHDLRMENLELVRMQEAALAESSQLARVRGFLGDGEKRPGIKYAKQMVIFSDKSMSPTILSVTANVRLEDCGSFVDGAILETGEEHHLSKDGKTCHMSWELPKVTPSHAIVVLLYSNEEVTQVSINELRQDD